MNKTARRVTRGLLLFVFAVIVGMAVTAWGLLHLSVPMTDGPLELAGPGADIEITFDEMGIPQIWAETEHDGYFALGYQHAADRMFQMDLVRRLSQGRLSEMLGDIALETDIGQRRIGHGRLAQKALQGLSITDRNRLQAYAAGVNAYRDYCRALPFEFRLLPTGFEDWTVYDCLALLSFQTWFSNALMSNEGYYLKLVEKLGIDQAARLLPGYPDWAPVTVPEGPDFGLLDETRPRDFGTRQYPRVVVDQDKRSRPAREYSSNRYQRSVARSLFADQALPLRMTTSSNAWAVAPERSASGRAVFASDPHLETTRLPQFWHYVGLHIKDTGTDVLGITVPGLPFFVMGHNGAAAWAFTVGGVDIIDYYEEMLNPEDSAQYLSPDGYVPLTTLLDTIIVAGGEPVVTELKFTRHGPLQMLPDSGGKYYALRWAGFDAVLSSAVNAGFELADVEDFETFRLAVTSFGALDANWLYADSAGVIGFQLGTPIPVRGDHQSSFPYPGWDDAFDWRGYRPLEFTPHVYSPPLGVLATCNNLQSRDPSLVGHFAPQRIMRITNLLDQLERFDAEDMWKYQMDIKSDYLQRWKGPLARALRGNGEDTWGEVVDQWDGTTSVDSRATPLVLTFLSKLSELTFEDELGELESGISTITLDRIYNSADSAWFDNINTPERIETREELLASAAEAAVGLMGEKTWGEVQTLTMRHPMASVPLVSSILDLEYGPWPWSGTAGTLNASYFRQTSDTTFRSIVGPSWRFVLDFANVDQATMVLPAGNSGNPMSPHFFDFNEMWQKGERWSVPFSEDKVRERAVSTLTLKAPEKSEEQN